jgi:hypothetical protein
MEKFQHYFYLYERSKRKRLIRKKNQSIEDRELIFKNNCYNEAKRIYELIIKNE